MDVYRGRKRGSSEHRGNRHNKRGGGETTGQERAQTQGFECPQCLERYDERLDPSIELLCGAEHRICLNCFCGNITSTPSLGGGIICKACNKRAKSFKTRSTQHMLGREGRSHVRMRKESYTVIPYDKVMDPVRFFENDKQEVNSFSLTMAYRKLMTDRTLVVESNIIPKRNSDSWNEECNRTLENIFKRLHATLVTEDEETKRQYNPLSYPTMASLNNLAWGDQGALHRSVFALAYGEKISDIEKRINSTRNTTRERTLWDNLIRQSFCIADLIRFFRSESGGAIKNLLSAHMGGQAVPENVLAILERFGLTHIRKTITRKAIKNAIEKVKDGFDFSTSSQFDFHVKIFDNEGFKVRMGKSNKVGYLQTIQHLLVRRSYQQLMDDGHYFDTANPNRPLLSRKSLDWKEEREKDDFVGYTAIKKINFDDYNYLAQTTFGIIGMILKQEELGLWPTYIEAEEMLNEMDFDYLEPIPDWREFGTRETLPSDNGTFTGTVEIEWHDDNNDDEEYPGLMATHLSINDAIMDIPLETDLNDMKSVENLAKISNEQRIGVLEKSPVQDPEWEGEQILHQVRPLHNDFPVALQGDGQPTLLLTILKKTNNLFSHLLLGIRGFHIYLTGWKALGRLYFEPIAKVFFLLWRNSEGQLKWVSDPGDPGQVERETQMFNYGVYLEAVRGLVRTKAFNNEIIEISTTDVNDFIIERGKEYPIVFFLLAYLRFVNILQVLRLAEHRASISFFLTAFKFISIFCCISHNTGYVSLGADWFRNWFCASPALRALYEKAILFRKTINGRNIFSDRFMEWVIRDTRFYSGKFATSSEDTHLNQVRAMALQLNNNLVSKRVLTKSESTIQQQNRRYKKIDKIFCETILFIRDANIFGPGPMKKIKPKPYKERRDQFDIPENMPRGQPLTLDGRPMNPEAYFGWTRAQEVDECYFDTYHISANDPDSVTRSERSEEGGVNLAILNPMEDPKEAHLEKERMRCASTDFHFLAGPGVYTHNELNKEISILKRELRELLPSGVVELEFINSIKASYKDPATGSRKSPADFKINNIINARRKLLEIDSQWGEKRIASIMAPRQDEINQITRDFPTKFDNEIKNNYYTLEQTTEYAIQKDIKYKINIKRCIDQGEENETNNNNNDNTTVMTGASGGSSSYWLSQSTANYNTRNVFKDTPDFTRYSHR